MLFKYIPIIFLFLLSSCATTYQKSGFSGGYTDQLTGKNTATIYFKSNAFTSISETRQFAMRRAAELTLSRGYDYFLIESENQYVKNQKLSGSLQSNTIGYYTTYNNVGGGTFRKLRIQLNIRMFKENVPNQTGYYDAKYLAR